MKFSTLTIISISTGKKLGKIEDAYKIIDFMTGDAIFTHQIPRAGRICGEELRRQFPEIAEITPDQITPENAENISGKIVARFGFELDVAPLPPGKWQPRDPIEELLEMQMRDCEGE